jgi:hypothetical protein
MEKRKGITYRSMFILMVILLVVFVFFWNFQLNSASTDSRGSSEKFTVDQSLIKLLLHPGQELTKSMRIKNIWGNDLDFYTDITGNIGDLVSIGNTNFDLSSGASKKVEIKIAAGAGKAPGVYVGNIFVESMESIEIPVVVEVESDYVFFDINLNAKVLNNLNPGDEIDFSIKIFDMQMGTSATSVRMEYSLLDMDGHEILSETESVVVLGQTEFNKVVTLPSSLDHGLYVFTAQSSYGKSVGVSTYLVQVSGFNVVSGGDDAFASCVDNNFCLFGMFSIVLIVVVTIVLLYTISLLRPRSRKERNIVLMKEVSDKKFTRFDRQESFKFPKIKLPRFNLSLPKRSEPVEVSKASAPKTSFSKKTVPKIKMPKLKLPRMKLPRIRLPKIRVPKFKTPRVRLPKLRLPKIRAPKIRVPKFRAPKLRLPRVQVPKVRVPRLNLHVLPKIVIRKPSFKQSAPAIKPTEISEDVMEVPDIKPRAAFKLPKAPKIRTPKFRAPKLPKLSLPRIRIPKIKAPRIKVPRVPKFKLPRVHLPKIGIPKFTIPKINLSMPKKPKIKTPKVKLLKIKAPKFNVPKFGVPRIKLPTIKAPKMPKFKVPRFKLPKIRIPKVKVPKFKVPKIKIPKVNFKMPKIKLPEMKLPELKTPERVKEVVKNPPIPDKVKEHYHKIKKKIDDI